MILFVDNLQPAAGRDRELRRRSAAALAAVARRLARHRRRQAPLEERVPDVPHDRRQARRLLQHGCQGYKAQLVSLTRLSFFGRKETGKFWLNGVN